MFITSQLCLLWLHELASKGSSEEVCDNAGLDSKWRVVLGVGSLSERLKSLRVQLSYLVAGLITAAIVASVTPSISTQKLHNYTPQVSSGTPYPLDFCASIFSSGQPPILGGYYWDLPGGKRMYVNAPGGGCPTRWAVRLAYGINTASPAEFAYTDSEVHVHASAMGAPVTIYSWRPGYSSRLRDLMRAYNFEVINTTQCVPVIRSNPISCHASGSLRVGANNLTAISDDGLCTISAQLLANPYTTNTMVKGLCTTGNVGQSKIILGATAMYAAWLAFSMGDQDNFDAISTAVENGNYSSRYVVTCDVDATNVYTFRNVTFSTRTNLNGNTALRLSAEGDSDCERPMHYSTDTSGLLAEVAISSWQLMSENSAMDGWFDTVANFAWNNGPHSIRTSFAFSNSRNGLEDVLGVTAAMVGAYMNSSTIAIPATVVVANMRVGSGYRYAVVFVLPPVLAAIAIGALTWRLLRRNDRHFSPNSIKCPRHIRSTTHTVIGQDLGEAKY
ncbi:hypothetical protein BKA66DRAFT_564364 [Pyrenochaeta sp. MPI-SDFR-AT-0127]|nr:hypothetical protein BKA66DRAFT_564364 [Pyrenochaeta sp. MPI-SDFR-AT-0127]